MKLKKILKGILGLTIKGPKDIEIISGIYNDSRYVVPGSLFIAKKGLTTDGADFIPDAIDNGARAVITNLYNPFIRNATQIIHKDINSIESKLAANYYENPAKELITIGITGTNGKTTVSYLIKQLLEKNKISCGLIGTIEKIIGENSYPSSLTTPDNISLQKSLRNMIQSSCKACVMEVSSHGLAQKRIDSIDFDIALFTNLTRDHLDYHKNLEAYAFCKAQLFSNLKKSGTAIFNNDSPWADFMKKDCKANILTYGIEFSADLMAKNIEISIGGTTFDLIFEDEIKRIKTKLIGKFNVYNTLAAIACGIAYKIPFTKILKLVPHFISVKGRMERIENDRGILILVDFAHTPDSLKNVLVTLNKIKKGRIITVFGCGGDRDKSKRFFMGKISSKFSDFSILTNDNPRNEDPDEIIEGIKRGFNSSNYIVEKNRREAIERAISWANEGDIILISGKGHEHTQAFSHQTIIFDDKEETYKILNRRT